MFQQDDSSKIVYRLEGQGVGEFFRVGQYSGDIEVIRPLDRDPPAGVSVWKFIVQAIDDDGHGLIGYSDVQVNQAIKQYLLIVFTSIFYIFSTFFFFPF